MYKTEPKKLVETHITSRGGQYVDADVLLACDAVRDVIQKMAKVPVVEIPVEENAVDQNL